MTTSGPVELDELKWAIKAIVADCEQYIEDKFFSLDEEPEFVFASASRRLVDLMTIRCECFRRVIFENALWIGLMFYYLTCRLEGLQL